jgi:hypothetical protein
MNLVKMNSRNINLPTNTLVRHSSQSGLSTKVKPASSNQSCKKLSNLSSSTKVSHQIQNELSVHVLLTPKQSSTPSESKFVMKESPIELLTHITSPKKLPTKLASLSQFELTQELSGLGTPATRKDVEELKGWLNTMLLKAMDFSNSPESLYETTNLIYKVCFQEIIRQVKVQCRERGDLIKLIWETYQQLFLQALKLTQAKQDFLESQHLKNLVDLQQSNEKQVNDLLKIIGETKKENTRLTRDLKQKEEAYEQKFHKEMKMLQVLDVFKQQYARIKEELLTVKEEYRITKIKFENLQNISSKAEQKFKKKSIHVIQQVIAKEPLMQYKGNEDDQQVIKSHLLNGKAN